MTEGWICKRERAPTEEDADENGMILVWHRYQCGMLYAWDDVCRNRFITHWMPLCLMDGEWIDARTRAPTPEDADALRCVLARHAVDGITVIGWFQIPGSTSYTHFARLPDAPGGLCPLPVPKRSD